MGVPVEVAAVLSGLHRGELRGLREPTPLGALDVRIVPTAGGYDPIDVRILRAVARLRTQHSLQHVRKSLRQIGYPELRRAAHADGDGELRELLGLRAVWPAFTNRHGERVHDLRRPRPLLRVHPDVCDGTPCIERTRVPALDVGLAFMTNGRPEAVGALYPYLTGPQIWDAFLFLGDVLGHSEP